MSRIYSACGSFSTGAAAAAPMCDLESSAVESPAILAIDFSVGPNLVTANTFSLGMGRASNTPISALGIPFQAGNPNDPPCTSTLAIAWSTAPAVPARFNRMFSYTNNVGQYNIFTFPNGLKLVPSSSFVVWVISTLGRALSLTSSWEIEL